MPFDNLSGNHFTPEEMAAVRASLVKLDAVIQPRMGNLSKEERETYGSVSEKNKLIINKVKDYLDHEPELSADDVDWKEFVLDYQDRNFISATMLTMQRMLQALDNTRILHDFDNYKAALRDYKFAKYKNDGMDARFETKVDQLKQFFNRTGTGGADEAADPEIPDTN